MPEHKSVLLHECIENLNIKPDGIYVDGTLGLGGHSMEIAKRLTTGRLIAIDQDETPSSGQRRVSRRGRSASRSSTEISARSERFSTISA